MTLEATVHSFLRAVLRAQGDSDCYWPHHLTMARLVARALRVGRPALVQTGSARNYAWSYLAPALLCPQPVVLVAPRILQQRLLQVEIPHLQRWLQQQAWEPLKEVVCLDRKTLGTLSPHYRGLISITPEDWLGDRLSAAPALPAGLVTLIDRADDLEAWARTQLSARIVPEDWEALQRHLPQAARSILDLRARLTRASFLHPPNPYGCYLLDSPEREALQEALQDWIVAPGAQAAAPAIARFWACWQAETAAPVLWGQPERQSGRLILHCSPTTVASVLAPIWQQQPIVHIGSFLDWEPKAPVYRQQLGLGELTCVRFAPSRQQEHVHLYLPDRIPLPNSPRFKDALFDGICQLLGIAGRSDRPTVAIIGDVPLKERIATRLAAEYGSRVCVETTALEERGVLVCGWEFWLQQQECLPAPQLLVAATLPLPSLEDPLVAGRVARYKQLHQDWFRLYLLPTALRVLQRALVPLRESQGTVALLDNRVNHRSYGQMVLSALEPYARARDLSNLQDLISDCDATPHGRR